MVPGVDIRPEFILLVKAKSGSSDNEIQEFSLTWAFMGYESLQHVREWKRVKPEVLLYFLTFRLF